MFVNIKITEKQKKSKINQVDKYDNIVYCHTMKPKEIQAIRKALGENTETFAERFARSSRTVESWEQGLRDPDALVLRILEKLKKRVE